MIQRKPSLLLFTFLLLASCASDSLAPASLQGGLRGLVADSSEPGTLFEYYETKGLAKRKSNWTRGLDLSGVSWNDTRTCTLISRQHVVMAAHYVRPSYVPVMFHDNQGRPHERYIVSVSSLAPRHDIAIGKLNLPLTSAIKHYAMASAANVSEGMDVLITDQTKKVSIHKINMIHDSGRVSFSYHPELAQSLRRNLIVGDSGNPTFILSGGDLKLLETHTYGGAGSGPNYSNPQVQTEVQAAMRGL